MIAHFRRALALGVGRDLLAAMGHVTKTQGRVAGLACSWSARRTILTSSAPPQFHTTASRKAPFTALPLPAAYPEETSTGRHLGESMTKAGRDVTERVVAGIQGVLAQTLKAGTRANQALEAWQLKRVAKARMVKEGYLQYLGSLSDGRMVSDELREGFDVPVGMTCDEYQYQPWQMLLERLFPDAFGYDIRLEKVLDKTLTFSDGDSVDLEDWFLVVRQPTTTGPRVRLLACGFDPTHPSRLERSFSKLMRSLQPMALRLMQSKQADETVLWLTFCGQDFCWGEMRGGIALRLGQISRVQEDAGEETLVQLAQHVHALSAR